MKKTNQEKIETAAKFSVGLGSICLILLIFSGADWGAKFRGMFAGLALLAWGSRQLVLANKRKRGNGYKNAGKKLEPEDRRLEKQMEWLDRSGSINSVFKLLSCVLLFIFIACAIWVGWLFLFHRK